MEEEESIRRESSSVDLERMLKVLATVCGLLSLAWLAVAPSASLGIRMIPALAGAMAVAWLVWCSLRQGGASECEQLERQLGNLKAEHEILEHYFETLLDQVPSNLYFKDADSRFLKVNQSMAESFGCSHPSEMLGKTDHDFFEGEHADLALADEQKIIRTGKGIEGQVEYETFADGRKGWVLTTKQPFRNRKGEIIGTFGMSSDVTELVETRDTLEKERNMLRSLIDSFPDKIFISDPGRRYLVVNRAMSEWVGLDSPEEMLGKKPDDFFPEEITDIGAKEDLDVLASGEPVMRRAWMLEQEGEGVRYMLTTKVPWVDPEGRCFGIVGIHHDATEEKEAQAQLERTQLLIQELMDNSPAVVYIKDTAGRYLMVNRGFEELFGLDRDDVLGRRDHDFIGVKEAANAFRDSDLKVLEKQESLQMDEQLFVDGEPRWYVSVKFPLRDADGRIHATAGISTNITDRKEAEVAMQKLNEQLVDVNKNLTLAQEQLIQAEKMESIGRLASGVAHEVKNPLAMIGMGLELISRRIPEDDKTGLEAVERMKRGIDRAKTIVKGLVDFSSARQIEKKPMSPNQIVRDALALVDYELKKGGIEVIEDLAGGLPEVEVDATKIEQVLVNLIINAMHAMGAGVIVLRTRMATIINSKRDEGARTAEHLRDGDRVVHIEVEDNGPGIESADAGKLFDPFYTTKPTGIGTGLGLSVSRKILDLHQGSLELTNRKDGNGAVATITLKATQELAGNGKRR